MGCLFSDLVDASSEKKRGIEHSVETYIPGKTALFIESQGFIDLLDLEEIFSYSEIHFSDDAFSLAGKNHSGDQFLPQAADEIIRQKTEGQISHMSELLRILLGQHNNA